MSQSEFEAINSILDVWNFVYPCKYRDRISVMRFMGSVRCFCFRNYGLCRDMLQKTDRESIFYSTGVL